MGWYIAGALLIIAGLYFNISWILYLGLLMLFAPLILLTIVRVLSLIGALMD